MKYMDGPVPHAWLYVFYDQDNYEDVFLLVGVYTSNFDKNKEFGSIINHQGLFYGIHPSAASHSQIPKHITSFLGVFFFFFTLNIFEEGLCLSC